MLSPKIGLRNGSVPGLDAVGGIAAGAAGCPVAAGVGCANPEAVKLRSTTEAAIRTGLGQVNFREIIMP
jgi:hypothetical protein